VDRYGFDVTCLEPSLTRGDIYSYRPDERIGFIGNRNGMTIPIRNRAMVKRLLNRRLRGVEAQDTYSTALEIES